MNEHARLKEIREERGYTPAEIAEVLGVSVRQVRRWEAGEAKMRVHHYIALARFYKMSLDDLVG